MSRNLINYSQSINIETKIMNINFTHKQLYPNMNDNPNKYKHYLPQKPKPLKRFSFGGTKIVQSFCIDKPKDRIYIDIKTDVDASAERESKAIKLAFKPHTIDFGKRKNSSMSMACLSNTPRKVHIREVWKKITL